MCTGVSPKRIATRNMFCVVPFRLFPPGGLTQQRKTLSFYPRHVLHVNAGHICYISGLLGTFYLVSTDNTTVKQPLLLLP